MERNEIERRTSDLRKQHKELFKEGYDGHNRRSGFINMRLLAGRRARRACNLYMKTLARDWITPSSKKAGPFHCREIIFEK